jgi:hypothetical protein
MTDDKTDASPAFDGMHPRADIKAQLDQHFDAILKLERNTIRNVIESGWHLLQIKKIKSQTPYGQFMVLVDDKFPFSLRSAERRMRLAETFWDRIDTVSILPIHLSALYLLAAHDVPEIVRNEAIKMAQLGRPVTKEIVKTLIAENGLPPPEDIVLRLEALMRNIKKNTQSRM